MKQYIAVEIKCSESLREILMAELGEAQYDSFLETEDGLEAYVERAHFDPSRLEEILRQYDLSKTDYQVQTVEEKNWNVEWEKHFEPILVDDQCLVRATFHQADKEYPYEIIIDPKMAFGTGHHATTYLMLQWQLELDQRNKSVIDAGCGTGVLAIMANKRGATQITAFDNNEWAVANSQENLELNQCSEIKLSLGTIQDVGAEQTVDLILANINRNVLLDEMDLYAQQLTSEGELLLSGFLEADQTLIEQRAQEVGLQRVGVKYHNGWVALLLG
ncbi:50S ribosomal protein L11 methyltransferase [Tunicatimonas pelagia]|uniref:50S ribosomal protein L11 methyltransferase n=1 Tax=Tunicatimonas pelagia TaxID=931531 RepID=UPI0026668BE6|nr:50S ribosomal protein L11 methyltransferase [Tunicatimonas pelagia]WKN46046.1 50S ribosomal protein L11 methyltransferase [Tunicatimonas pelagia]